jgi:hypothetical protein
MFDKEKNGYKKTAVEYYIKRLDDDFQEILKGQAERFENVTSKIATLAKDLNEYSQVVPQYKSEIDSLKERLQNIREAAEFASEERYLSRNDIEVVLANFIAQVLKETDKIDELKIQGPKVMRSGGDFFEELAGNKEIKLDDALKGFDFYDNNPYKTSAERKLAKIEAKKRKK